MRNRFQQKENTSPEIPLTLKDKKIEQVEEYYQRTKYVNNRLSLLQGMQDSLNVSQLLRDILVPPEMQEHVQNKLDVALKQLKDLSDLNSTLRSEIVSLKQTNYQKQDDVLPESEIDPDVHPYIAPDSIPSSKLSFKQVFILGCITGFVFGFFSKPT
jgi:hypothetical protein